MMFRSRFFVLYFILFFACNSKLPTTPPANAQPLELTNAFPDLSFSSPVFLTSSDDGTDRIFVVEQAGVIRVFRNDSAASSTATFLDIRARVTAGGEMGLLGLAFHPNYETNGLFYVNYTSSRNGPRRTVIAEFSAMGDQANANSERILLEIGQFASNHNGGMLAFGGDGFLYIGMGDGGGGGDPQNNGQDRTTLLGAILRIDIDNQAPNLQYAIPPDNPFVGVGGGVREEIFAYGLRNPWRFSIDAQTSQLWVGDVGQNRLEEIDLIMSGRNYGWPRMEGFDCFNQNNFDNPPASCDQSGLTLPIKDYAHGAECSVTGGYIYRGNRRAELAGAYIYGDYCSGRIWMLRHQGGSVTADSLLINSSLTLSSFGVDENGELYMLDIGGSIFRFTGPAPTSVTEDAVLPDNFGLGQNYPNPFNPQTSIPYEIKKASFIELTIFNTLGQKIRTLLQEEAKPGNYEVFWDGKTDRGGQVSSGLYIYELKSAFSKAQKKMILSK